VLTGPTASGKSSLAMELAESCRLEILSMDSMAVYRRMDIGTAKPDRMQLETVPHHLIDLVEPNESFDAYRYCTHAEAALAGVRSRGAQPLFVGGTPLYLMAFFKGLMAGPGADPELRAELHARERQNPGSLHRELSRSDPAASERIHRRDIKRLVRALEVIAQSREPISERQQQFDRPGWRMPCRVVAISLPREVLHQRVRDRTVEMLDRGLLEEVRSIRDSCGFSREAAGAIGYRECLDYLDGRLKDTEELRNRIRRSTHRLIRRQTTWLRRLPEVRWISRENGSAAALGTLQG
jgi:tRNA dimethylallyltransferase